MYFQTPLVSGRLLQRYKRFLADIELENGQIITAHCANTGAMTHLKTPGLKVWIEPNNDPRKKLKYGWRFVEFENGAWVGIDTSLPNKVVKEALVAQQIAPLAAYQTIIPEQKYGTNARIDFLLKQEGLPDTYVEVKNVNFNRHSDLVEFPDTVTARGTKHLHELARLPAQGKRAVMLYLVQHTGCRRFGLARDIDPAYATAHDQALQAGVEMLCYSATLSVQGITLGAALGGR